ncbi:STAS domain-containing protein [Streptomyces bambusae]|uniref:STAS domain-containing protein n=1 Tax=Streptomyces bambusae TaxID=1550616 RepID=UPI001CFE9828|nr:STAS domain-containing protein [Streptomyces bambusae]MCB5168632.1 STAS domain-containing protein [Streptomyces bambusae]
MNTSDGTTLTVPGPAPGPGDTAALCARLIDLCRHGPPGPGADPGPAPGSVHVDVSAVTEPGLAAVDLLARLALTARRHGTRLRVTGAGGRLRALLALAGLTDLLGQQPLGQAEHREPPVGVQEGIDPDDLPV